MSFPVAPAETPRPCQRRTDWGAPPGRSAAPGGTSWGSRCSALEQIRLIPGTAQRRGVANSNLVGTQHSRESALYCWSFQENFQENLQAKVLLAPKSPCYSSSVALLLSGLAMTNSIGSCQFVRLLLASISVLNNCFNRLQKTSNVNFFN